MELVSERIRVTPVGDVRRFPVGDIQVRAGGMPAEGEALFLRKGLSVVGDMLTNKGGDKVITVVIAILHSELQVNAIIVTGFLQRFGL